MFGKSTLPTHIPAGLPDDVLAALEDYRHAVEMYDRAWDVDGLGDKDLDAAKTADNQLVMAALADGRDIEEVGRPNEAAFLNKQAAYRKARELAGLEASETAFRVASVLGEHADTIVDAYLSETLPAVDAYLAAIDALAAARGELEVRANRLSWATRIDGRSIPSLADEHFPRTIHVKYSGARTTEQLVENLKADARELQGRTLEARAERIAEEQRAADAERRNAERLAQIAAERAASRKSRAIA